MSGILIQKLVFSLPEGRVGPQWRTNFNIGIYIKKIFENLLLKASQAGKLKFDQKHPKVVLIQVCSNHDPGG